MSLFTFFLLLKDRIRHCKPVKSIFSLRIWHLYISTINLHKMFLYVLIQNTFTFSFTCHLFSSLYRHAGSIRIPLLLRLVSQGSYTVQNVYEHRNGYVLYSLGINEEYQYLSGLWVHLFHYNSYHHRQGSLRFLSKKKKGTWAQKFSSCVYTVSENSMSQMHHPLL